MESINLTPDYEKTAAWFARVLAQHGFDRNALDPVISLIEQVRYLSQTDLPAVERILNGLRVEAAQQLKEKTQ